MQSGRASVAENVTARALGVKPQFRVIEGGKPLNVRQPLDKTRKGLRIQAKLLIFVGSPGRNRNHMEKTGNFSGFVTTPRADTPKHTPSDERLFLDTPSLYWKLRIHAGPSCERQYSRSRHLRGAATLLPDPGYP